MIPLIVNGPAVEPVALADAKKWLKAETSEDDDVIGALITAARLMLEAQIRRILITQTWRLIFDRWPNGRLIKIPLAPFQSLTAMRVYDANGAAQAVSAALYHVDSAPDLARIIFGAPPPNPGRNDAGIEMDIVVGYGAAPETVPEPLRQAIRILVTDWYENRGDALVQNSSRSRPSPSRLIATWRGRSIGAPTTRGKPRSRRTGRTPSGSVCVVIRPTLPPPDDLGSRSAGIHPEWPRLRPCASFCSGQ